MTVPATRTTYQGKLRQQTVHLASGQTLVTDGPVAYGGRGEMISPADLLSATLASCAMTIMAIKAEAAGADFTGCSAESSKELAEDFRVKRISITFRLKAAFDSKLRAELESASRDLCIVGRSLSADLEQQFEFIYE